MYRTGKPFYGCAKLFVLFLLFVYAVATSFTFEVEGAKTSPSRREIEEAQKIVGRFLRNEAGTKWLSSLAKTKSAPLTAEDLTNAIINTTKPEGKVWRAASTIRDALKSQTSGGIKSDAIMGQIANWKDLIADIEEEDNIICLYRKNTEPTAKKAEDWQKFLKTVTPGYTVHLAIDTGLKYVICLKKIEVPEVTSTEASTSSVTLSTTVPSTIPQEITTSKQSLQAIIPEKLKTINPLVISNNTNNTKSNIKPEESEESREASAAEETEDNKPEELNDSNEFIEDNFEDDDNDYFLNDSFENEDSKKKSNLEMEDFTENLKDYPLKFENVEERTIPTMNRRSNFPFKKRRNRLSYPPLDTQRRSFSDYSKKLFKCNRPIIVVVQDGSLPLGYRPQYPLQLSAQRSFVPFQLPSIPRIPIPRPQFPWPPFNPPAPANKLPQFSKFNNVVLPIRGYSTFIYKGGPQKMLSTTTHFSYTIPRENIQAKPTEIKAIGQTTQSALVQNKKLLHDQFIRQRPKYYNPTFNSFPRKVDRLSIPNVRDTTIPINGSSGMSGWKQIEEKTKSDPNIGNTAISTGGSSGMFQWNQIKPARNSDLNIRNTVIPMGGLSRLSKWNEKISTEKSVANIRNTARSINEVLQLSGWGHTKPATNILFPKVKIPDQSQFIRNDFPSRLEEGRMKYLNRQSMINRIKSLLASQRPIVQSTAPFMKTDLSIPKQQSTIQSQPLMYGRSVPENSNMNQRFPVGLQPSWNQKIDPFNSQLSNKLRSEQMPFQIQSTNPRANFPAVNNFLRTQRRQSSLLKSSISNPASMTSGNNFYPRRNDGPCMKNLKNQIPHYHTTSCANSCDKPIKLKIVIQGKVEEPLKFSVLTEPNQRLEIVGSDNPMSYGSRAANRGTFMRPMTKKTEKEKIYEVAEIGKRFYDREEQTGKNENEKSVMNSTSDKFKKLANEESSTREIVTEIMTTEDVTENSTMQEIGERILLNITTLPSLRFDESSIISTIKNSTIITDVTSTMSTTTNSTIIA